MWLIKNVVNNAMSLPHKEGMLSIYLSQKNVVNKNKQIQEIEKN